MARRFCAVGRLVNKKYKKILVSQLFFLIPVVPEICKIKKNRILLFFPIGAFLFASIDPPC